MATVHFTKGALNGKKAKVIIPVNDYLGRYNILNPTGAEAKLSTFLGIPDLDFSHMRRQRFNDGSMPQFYFGENGEEYLSIEGIDYRIPADTLLLAHAKGTQVWRGIKPEKARANIAAAQHWTRRLTTRMIEVLFDFRFEDDLKQLHEDFGVDVVQWRSRTEAVAYDIAMPELKFLHKVR